MSNKKVTEIINPQSITPIIFSCEHAGFALPFEAEPLLGIGEKLMHSHNSYDAGAKEVTIACANKLNATAVMGIYSRLWIDLNRQEDSASLIRANIYDTIIKSNYQISAEDKNYRIENYHRPFYKDCLDNIERVQKAAGAKPIIISIHAFTRQMEDATEPRSWDIGLLYNKDETVFKTFKSHIEKHYPQIRLGNNQPYSLKGNSAGGMVYYAEKLGLPHILLEICDDKIKTSQEVDMWSDMIVSSIKEYKN